MFALVRRKASGLVGRGGRAIHRGPGRAGAHTNVDPRGRRVRAQVSAVELVAIGWPLGNAKGAGMSKVVGVILAGLLVALLVTIVSACGPSTTEPTAEEYKALFTQWGEDLNALPDTAVVGAIGVDEGAEAPTSDAGPFSKEEIAKTKQAITQLEDLIKEVKAVTPPGEYAEVHASFLGLLETTHDMASTASSMAEDGAAPTEIQGKLGSQVDAYMGQVMTYMSEAFSAGLIDTNRIDSDPGQVPSTELDPNITQPGDGASSRENAVPPGQGATVGDWTVTVISVTPDATAKLLENDGYSDPPQVGNQYVLASVEATYNGTESGDFSLDIGYKFVGSKGNTFGSPEGYVVSPNPIWDAGEAFPGASVSGDLLFEVPTDQVSGGTLMFEEAFSFDDNRVFYAIE